MQINGTLISLYFIEMLPRTVSYMYQISHAIDVMELQLNIYWSFNKKNLNVPFGNVCDVIYIYYAIQSVSYF